jgi:hypothetical protein
VERRRATRFSLELPVNVTRAGPEPVVHFGMTRNISSSGVLFSSDQEFAMVPIEYTVVLNGRGPQIVKIKCIGRVVRVQAENDERLEIAATLERYEFVRE